MGVRISPAGASVRVEVDALPKSAGRREADVYLVQADESGANEVAGGEIFSGKIANCDPKVEEAFLENVLALETHGFVSPFYTLVKDGFDLPPPDKVEDAAFTGKLWELIRELARRRLFLHSTDHLNDRELYT